MAIEAGLQAETYGYLPHEVMAAHHLSPIQQFRFNQAVRTATAEVKEEERERRRNQQGSSVPQEAKQDMEQSQKTRNKMATAQQESGNLTPSADGQLEALSELKEREGEFERKQEELV